MPRDLIEEMRSIPGFDPKQYSAAVIHCTTPTYLYFRANQQYPSYVAKVSDRKQQARLFAMLGSLHKQLPTRIPEPVANVEISNGKTMLVQRGFPGLPWPRVCSRTVSVKAWKRVRTQAVNVLREFSDAVQAVPEWNVHISPRKEFDNVLRRIDQCEFELTENVFRLSHSAAAEWNDSVTIPCHFQHGDFCINNLLFASDSSIGIVDFDDFGSVAVPMFDAHSLAFSVNCMASDRCKWNSLEADITECAAGMTMQLGERKRKSLFVLYLLVALQNTIGKPARGPMAARYLKELGVLGNAWFNESISLRIQGKADER